MLHLGLPNIWTCPLSGISKDTTFWNTNWLHPDSQQSQMANMFWYTSLPIEQQMWRKGLTDFIFPWWFISVFDSVPGSLRCVDVVSVAHVSEVYSVSICMVEVNRVGERVNIHIYKLHTQTHKQSLALLTLTLKMGVMCTSKTLPTFPTYI
jgi:hypothetical protein